MPEHHPSESEEDHATDVSPRTLRFLERTDTLAHVVVAIFFLLLSITVLFDTGIVFVKQMPLLFQSMTSTQEPANVAPAKPNKPEQNAAPNAAPPGNSPETQPGKNAETTPESPSAGSNTPSQSKPEGDKKSGEEAGSERKADTFVSGSLTILSSILFAVIILELLRTIITYLQTRNIQAIMKEFLVVGIISSVRKILLVGAESSMQHAKGNEFIQEAIGTIITIAGIILLIFGLIILNRAFSARPASVKSIL